MYSKYLDFPNVPVLDPTTPYQPATQFFVGGPRLHEFLREMRKENFDKYDVVSIGELPGANELEVLLEYVSVDAAQVSIAHLFILIFMY